MPDTGAPWNIPYVAGTDLVADWPTDNQTMAEAIADALDTASLFDSVTTITATDASWAVPTLLSPVVKVTVVGGGGEGGPYKATGTGSAGSSTVFGSGETWAVTATGGNGGTGGYNDDNEPGQPGQDGLRSANAGAGGSDTAGAMGAGQMGNGGQVVIGYVDLDGVSTVNVQIGAGGSGGGGGDGGDGIVIVEYKAG